LLDLVDLFDLLALPGLLALVAGRDLGVADRRRDEDFNFDRLAVDLVVDLLPLFLAGRATATPFVPEEK